MYLGLQSLGACPVGGSHCWEENNKSTEELFVTDTSTLGASQYPNLIGR